MRPKIFIISGLGADERVFQLLDLSDYEVVFVEWIKPLHKEKIEHYAARLLTQITSPNPVIIGLSFGGMMAIEISKLIPTKKIILLSSAKTKQEIPFYLKILGNLGLDYIVPSCVLKQSNIIVDWFFGVKGYFEKKLLHQILKDMDSIFLKWSIHQVLHWNNLFVPPNLTHIHGTADRLLPAYFIKANELIPNAGHFMVLTFPTLISARINALLQSEIQSKG
jgi:pimeloyl-ACP methyl ester carboxylesterase